MSQVTTLPKLPETVPNQTESKRDSSILILVAAVVLLLAHLPLLIQLAIQMWAKEHYQFFPMVLVGTGYLAYVRRDLFRERTRPGMILAGLFWLGTLVVFAGGVLINSPWMIGVSALGCLWSGAYSIGGRLWLKHLLPTWLFLLIALPLPSQFDFRLINWLQRHVSEWASGTLDLMGYRHNLDGVDLTFVQRAFKVEEACSGIHSFFAALCCTVFYLASGRRSLFRYLYLIPATVFWVLVANVLRILLVTLLSMEWGLPVDEGWGHELFGVFVFVFSLAMIFSTDRFFQFFLPLREAEGGEPIGAPSRIIQREIPQRDVMTGVPKFSFAATCAVWFLMILFVGLGSISFARGTAIPEELNITWDESDFRRVEPAQLQADWNGWVYAGFREEKRDFGHPLGAFSQAWGFQKGRIAASLSLDSPYLEWHDLGICYRNIGWGIDREEDFTYPEDSHSKGYRSELELARSDGRYQYVFFSAFDSKNRSLPPPAMYRMQLTRRLWDDVKDLGKLFTESAPTTDGGAVYQVQLLVESRTKLGEKELQECRELFNFARQTISGN